jgi:hypothetical protein
MLGAYFEDNSFYIILFYFKTKISLSYPQILNIYDSETNIIEKFKSLFDVPFLLFSLDIDRNCFFIYILLPDNIF